MLRQLKTGDELATYRLERRLGEGAFAEVWLATEEGSFGFRKQVALKVLKEEQATDEHFKSLVNEARVCGYLHHPHLVDVYGVAEAGELRFIAMEFVDGVPMDRLLSACNEAGLALPPSVILDIGIQIAQALDHAHRATDDARKPLNLVHRDLKPANVLLASRGGAKVTDFGIAKASTAVTETATGMLKGTPCYVAPEVWKGTREFLPRVDLFALGAMLWEMAVGHRLMNGEGIPALVGQALHGDVEAETAELEAVFAELAPTVRRLIEREPEQRMQSAREVEAALKDVRRRVPAPGELELFLDLFHAAMGAPLAEHLAMPETDHPSWTQLIEAARSASQPLPSVFDMSDETADLPSDGATAPSLTDGVVSGYEDTVALPSDGSVPAPGLAAAAAVTRPMREPPKEAAPPPVPRPAEPDSPPTREPAGGTESVVLPTRLEATAKPPARWPLALLLLAVLGAAALVVALLLADPAPDDAPTDPPTHGPGIAVTNDGEEDALADLGMDDLALGDGFDLGVGDEFDLGAADEGEEPDRQSKSTEEEPEQPAGTVLRGGGGGDPVEDDAPIAAELVPPKPTPAPVADARAEPTPEPVAKPTPQPTPEPTPEQVAAATPGCVVFQSQPTGADVCIGGAAAGFRARAGTSSRREYPDGALTVGMGIGGSCIAETTVQVQTGSTFYVRCDVATRNTCQVRTEQGVSCGSL